MCRLRITIQDLQVDLRVDLQVLRLVDLKDGHLAQDRKAPGLHHVKWLQTDQAILLQLGLTDPRHVGPTTEVVLRTAGSGTHQSHNMPSPTLETMVRHHAKEDTSTKARPPDLQAALLGDPNPTVKSITARPTPTSLHSLHSLHSPHSLHSLLILLNPTLPRDTYTLLKDTLRATLQTRRPTQPQATHRHTKPLLHQ